MLKYTLISPLKPTLARYWRIFWKSASVSIFRALQYEELGQIEYRGRVLDFGGGRRAHYRELLESWLVGGVYESANIDPSMEPTYLIQPGGAVPVEAKTYDMVVSINTLEHVYDIEAALDEMLRVVKPGGRIVISVPFLFRVHGCPDDFNRPTASWWRETFSRRNVAELAVTPLAWDGMTTGVAVIDGVAPFSMLRRVSVPLLGLIYGFLKGSKGQPRYPADIGTSLSYLALGYVITARVGK